ncbi:Hypothetical predicted protein [Xyrichtys novacula]|uniref:Uncharacterized protein n=1 Tax=Xyrichtys novacula TaxID=13765 RepID=A0AAV1HPI9_XYRNO|nr:Hypothetical predicted protein [Xyrichtys novacula]
MGDEPSETDADTALQSSAPFEQQCDKYSSEKKTVRNGKKETPGWEKYVITNIKRTAWCAGAVFQSAMVD